MFEAELAGAMSGKVAFGLITLFEERADPHPTLGEVAFLVHK
jgi:hypothetical protein